MASLTSAPTIGELELFLSVLDTGSLSRAAARHVISQPAASARLRALERRLGVQLIERTSGGSTPTAAGLSVGTLAADVVEAMSRLVDGAAALHADGGQLRVVAS